MGLIKKISLGLLLFFGGFVYPQVSDVEVYYDNTEQVSFEFDDDLLAILKHCDISGIDVPNITTLYHLNNLIVKLKASGIWDKLDTFYNYAYNDVTVYNFASYDLKRIGVKHSVFGGMAYQLGGYKGNGINGHIVPNYNPNTGANYSLNNASIFFVSYSYSLGNHQWVTDGISTTRLSISGVTNVSGNRLHGTNWFSSVQLSGNGFKYLGRNSSGSVLSVSVSASNVYSHNSSSVPLGTRLFGNAANVNNSPNGISCFAAGAYLSYEETQIFRALYNDFLTKIGYIPVA